jgi:hypothetical protein
MFTRHHLTCERAGCARAFTATRSDARFCSRRCRRDKTPHTPLAEVVEPAISTAEEAPAAVDDDLDGWRRVPGGYAPPFDQRNVVRVDWLR